jgi:hypothetical protein
MHGFAAGVVPEVTEIVMPAALRTVAERERQSSVDLRNRTVTNFPASRR